MVTVGSKASQWHGTYCHDLEATALVQTYFVIPEKDWAQVKT